MRTDRIVTEVLGGEVTITPADIFGKRFHRALFGGYQGQEVDGFLERVADVLEAVIRENRELKDRIEEYKAKSEDYTQMQETLRSALVTSQKFAENVIESARREAGTIVESGRVEKERILTQATRLPVALAQEINQLQQHRGRLRKEMTALLATHRTLLDSLAPAEEAAGLGSEETVFFGIHTDAQDRRPSQFVKPRQTVGSGSECFEPVSDDGPDSEEESSL
jgi:cell division initiation protein